MRESLKKGTKLAVVLGVLLLVGTIATTVAVADSQIRSNKPLKTPINPVKLEPGQVITPFGIFTVTKMTKTPDGVTHVEGVRVDKKPAQPPVISDGWIEDAWDFHANGYDGFSGKWKVPASPTQTGSLIYLFTGLEPTDSSDILQPVLQWGYNGLYGGNYWTIVAWWYKNSTAFAYSNPVNVNVGDVLSGYIYYTLTPSQWSVQISDDTTGGLTRLTVTASPSYTYSYVALEGFNINTCSQLSGDTDFYSLALYEFGSGSQVTPSWTPWQNSTDCGLDVNIVSPSEVTLNT